MSRLVRPETYRARQLRAASTEAERALWHLLRGRRLAGLKFRRQQPLGPFIVDFFCTEAGLVVEADGPIHLARALEDRARDAWRDASGFQVLRFRNEDILQRPRGVLRCIVRPAKDRLRRLRNPLPLDDERE